jgi:hypothetical protein
MGFSSMTPIKQKMSCSRVQNMINLKGLNKKNPNSLLIKPKDIKSKIKKTSKNWKKITSKK